MENSKICIKVIKWTKFNKQNSFLTYYSTSIKLVISEENFV